MQHNHGKRDNVLFTNGELMISITQGIVITVGALFLYYHFMQHGANLSLTRAIVFTTLIISNVFLTFANRSFTKTVFYTSKYKNILAPFIILVSASFLAVLHFVPFVRSLFQISPITLSQFWLCMVVAFASVMWFEIYKAILQKLKGVN